MDLLSCFFYIVIRKTSTLVTHPFLFLFLKNKTKQKNQSYLASACLEILGILQASDLLLVPFTAFVLD